jgi:hypothetical protein
MTCSPAEGAAKRDVRIATSRPGTASPAARTCHTTGDPRSIGLTSTDENSGNSPRRSSSSAATSGRRAVTSRPTASSVDHPRSSSAGRPHSITRQPSSMRSSTSPLGMRIHLRPIPPRRAPIPGRPTAHLHRSAQPASRVLARRHEVPHAERRASGGTAGPTVAPYCPWPPGPAGRQRSRRGSRRSQWRCSAAGLKASVSDMVKPWTVPG